MKLTEIERCRVIAQARFGVDPQVTVDWTQRGMAAGYCKYLAGGSAKIRLNAAIAKAEGDSFVKTIAHEYAHAVAWALFHKRNFGALRMKDHHGWQWQQIMNAFGYPADRCHSYESAVPSRVVEKFKYRCGCGPVQLVGPKIHAKIQRGSKYFCGKCKRVLVAERTATADELLARILGDK
jgi:SprT protein